MKIDPVFVLAPLPKPPSIPTRRAFLIAAGAFVAGGAVGGACGYSVGAAKASPGGGAEPPAAAPAAEIEWKPSGDAELEEMRRLAVKAPLDELFQKVEAFLGTRVAHYRTDEIVWMGIDRLSKEIVENPARRVSPIVIAVIAGQIESAARPASPSLRERLPALRLRRQQEAARK